MAEENETDSPQDAVAAGKAAQGIGTATGQEALRRSGNEDGRATSSAHTDEIEGAHADYLGDAAEPVGKQAEPAVFVGNGALGVGMVGSPSGPVPVASVARTAEEAEQRIEERNQSVADTYNNTSSSQRISDEKLSRMNTAEIRAVGIDRGYDLSTAAGGRALRSMFRKAQDEDMGAEEPANTAPAE